jgi:hypothetical protein
LESDSIDGLLNQFQPTIILRPWFITMIHLGKRSTQDTGVRAGEYFCSPTVIRNTIHCHGSIGHGLEAISGPKGKQGNHGGDK